MEDTVFINGVEQVNIGTIEKPYYVARLSDEQIRIYKEFFKNKNKKK